MLAKDVRDRLRTRPFEPIRIFVSDGSHYDIPHPEFVAVSATRIVIGLNPDSADVPQQFADVDPEHITRIEPASNGS